MCLTVNSEYEHCPLCSGIATSQFAVSVDMETVDYIHMEGGAGVDHGLFQYWALARQKKRINNVPELLVNTEIKKKYAQLPIFSDRLILAAVTKQTARDNVRRWLIANAFPTIELEEFERDNQPTKFLYGNYGVHFQDFAEARLKVAGRHCAGVIGFVDANTDFRQADFDTYRFLVKPTDEGYLFILKNTDRCAVGEVYAGALANGDSCVYVPDIFVDEVANYDKLREIEQLNVPSDVEIDLTYSKAPDAVEEFRYPEQDLLALEYEAEPPLTELQIKPVAIQHVFERLDAVLSDGVRYEENYVHAVIVAQTLRPALSWLTVNRLTAKPFVDVLQELLRVKTIAGRSRFFSSPIVTTAVKTVLAVVESYVKLVVADISIDSLEYKLMILMMEVRKRPKLATNGTVDLCLVLIGLLERVQRGQPCKRALLVILRSVLIDFTAVALNDQISAKRYAFEVRRHHFSIVGLIAIMADMMSVDLNMMFAGKRLSAMNALRRFKNNYLKGFSYVDYFSVEILSILTGRLRREHTRNCEFQNGFCYLHCFNYEVWSRVLAITRYSPFLTRADAVKLCKVANMGWFTPLVDVEARGDVQHIKPLTGSGLAVRPFELLYRFQSEGRLMKSQLPPDAYLDKYWS
jgi:hypothetical protein